MDFPTWLKHEMDARGLSQSELARRSGFTPTSVSRILRRERLPGVDFCRGVARAFGMTDIQVLEIAGLATDSGLPKFSPIVEAAAAMLNDLSEEDQEEIRAMVRVKWERQQRRAVTKKHD